MALPSVQAPYAPTSAHPRPTAALRPTNKSESNPNPTICCFFETMSRSPIHASICRILNQKFNIIWPVEQQRHVLTQVCIIPMRNDSVSSTPNLIHQKSHSHIKSHFPKFIPDCLKYLANYILTQYAILVNTPKSQKPHRT